MVDYWVIIHHQSCIINDWVLRMFQTVSIIASLVTFVAIAAHWALTPAGGPRSIVRGAVHAFSLLLIEQRFSLLGALKKLAYILAFICFVVLTITGFWPVLVKGEHISGYLMMIHATFAPVFALCLAVLALTWASGYRFTADDCPWVRRLLRRFTRLEVPADTRPWRRAPALRKATFWLLMFLALPLILSIVVSMFYLLGTHWQHLTLALHRWTALVFVIVAVFHTYLAIRIRTAPEA
jgi:cytochrome b subunit of formate dehydrogenase